MKKIISIVALLVVIWAGSGVNAQVYGKLNLLYAAVGVINPQFEFVFSNRSTVAVDATFSPWKSFNNRHMFFGMFNGEYRFYIKQAAQGFYVAGNAGMMGFDINKPYFFKDGLINFNRNYGKGFGLIVGVGVGYQHHFAERWVVDAFVAAGYLRSWYNGYNPDGTIVMDPQGHEDYVHPDPFNGSSEVMPYKAGISIGYKLFKGRD